MARFGTDVASTNTGSVLNYEASEPAYAATLTAAPDAYTSYYTPAALTGALTLTVDATSAQKYDNLHCIFSGSGGARVVTFAGDAVVAGTLTAASAKQASITLVFDGTSYVEASRFVEP